MIVVCAAARIIRVADLLALSLASRGCTCPPDCQPASCTSGTHLSCCHQHCHLSAVVSSRDGKQELHNRQITASESPHSNSLGEEGGLTAVSSVTCSNKLMLDATDLGNSDTGLEAQMSTAAGVLIGLLAIMGMLVLAGLLILTGCCATGLLLGLVLSFAALLLWHSFSASLRV